MKRYIALIILSIATSQIISAEGWTMEECMAYSVKHSTDVQQARWDLASSKIEQRAAIANFLPSVIAQSSAQFNWGRNIDPETNTYNNVTSFNNGYGFFASMTIFDGGQTFNRWKEARLRKEQSKNSIDMHSDDCAIATMMAFVDAVYFREAAIIAQEKVYQSEAILTLTSRQEELGIKGLPDVAQAKANLAEDKFNLVQQHNQHCQAILALKTAMNYPISEDIELDTVNTIKSISPFKEDTEDIYNKAIRTNPIAIDANINVNAALYKYRTAKGLLYPSISINAGVSTAYNKLIAGGTNKTVNFNQQFKNNVGEYFSATISIPIFNRLNIISSKKKAKHSYEIAKIQRDKQYRKLYNDIVKAEMDRQGLAAEIISLSEKVKADSLSYSLNKKKYNEGLLSLIDLQTTANDLYTSKIDLLQKRMLYILKEKLVSYYKGEPLYI